MNKLIKNIAFVFNILTFILSFMFFSFAYGETKLDFLDSNLFTNETIVINEENIISYDLNLIEAHETRSDKSKIFVSLVFLTDITDKFENKVSGSLFFFCDTGLFANEIQITDLFNKNECERIGRKAFYNTNALSVFINELDQIKTSKFGGVIGAIVGGLLGGMLVGGLATFGSGGTAAISGAALGAFGGGVLGFNVGAWAERAATTSIHNRRVLPISEVLNKDIELLSKDNRLENDIDYLHIGQINSLKNKLKDFFYVFESEELKKLEGELVDQCRLENPNSDFTNWQRFSRKHEDARESCVENYLKIYTSNWAE